MKIVVLTYTVPHRKTYDTLCLLKTKGYEDVTVIAKPMSYTKKKMPSVQHRPSMDYLVPSTELVCDSFNYTYVIRPDYLQKDFDDAIVLVCGAGLIPQEIVDNTRIINAHPGYIPNTRGLDALKWAILEDEPIGVTTHYLGDQVDAGEVIERRELPIQPNESFFELSMRVYYNEIDMLVNALENLDASHMFIDAADSELHRRMPTELEEKMMLRYEERVNRVC